MTTVDDIPYLLSQPVEDLTIPVGVDDGGELVMATFYGDPPFDQILRSSRWAKADDRYPESKSMVRDSVEPRTSAESANWIEAQGGRWSMAMATILMNYWRTGIKPKTAPEVEAAAELHQAAAAATDADAETETPGDELVDSNEDEAMVETDPKG